MWLTRSRRRRLGAHRAEEYNAGQYPLQMIAGAARESGLLRRRLEEMLSMANPRRTTRRTTAPRPRVTPAPTTAVAVAVETLPSEGGKQIDWKSEYAYVIRDLRQLGIVTAGIFALLLIVGLFI